MLTTDDLTDIELLAFSLERADYWKMIGVKIREVMATREAIPDIRQRRPETIEQFRQRRIDGPRNEAPRNPNRP